ncbi:MAG: fumarylacetoacetate hydrolase family protein [Bacteroidaceae bacterium]|jgi:2-keto-4-pentenoate hydratase/2-oxohepta-3-ene-1,7-dioic acid hydratase in catechol pathway|nr:fumarylacetoacetate hydrolase family protein [Bacteroidaceae bacterium]
MKIIVITENLAKGNNEVTRALNMQEPVVSLKADSTLLKGGKPLFLPDFAERCSAGLHLVVRISRLGKSIPRRFASRYYDAVTVGLDVRADDVVERLSDAGLPWDGGESFDGSAVIGDFIPLSEPLKNEHTVTLFSDGERVLENNMSEWRWQVDELIEYVSRYAMVRQGDFLFCGPAAVRLPLKIGRHLHAEIDGRGVLDFNIK